MVERRMADEGDAAVHALAGKMKFRYISKRVTTRLDILAFGVYGCMEAIYRHCPLFRKQISAVAANVKT